MQTYPDDEQPKPLLPPWATETDIANAVRTMEHDIQRTFQKLDEGRKAEVRRVETIEKQVVNWAPILERETEAYLTHIAEGW